MGFTTDKYLDEELIPIEYSIIGFSQRVRLLGDTLDILSATKQGISVSLETNL